MNRAHSHSINSSPKYLFNLIDSIEKAYPVDNIELLDGTKIWNLIRVILYFYPLKIGANGEANVMNLKTIWRLFKEGFFPLDFLNKKIDICGFSGTESRKIKNGKLFDIYLDPLYEIFPKNFYVFEWANQHGFRRGDKRDIYSPNYIPMYIPISSKTFLALIINRFIYQKPVIKPHSAISSILNYFCKKTNTDFNNLKKNIYDSITVFFVLKNFFHNILQSIKPKIVFIRCGYGRFHMALTQASKELGIPSVELQHGIISRYHAGYVKSTKSQNMDCIPEYLLTYGDVFTDIVSQGNLFCPSNVITTGYPYLEKTIESKPVVDEKLTNFASNYEYTILITSQWTVSKELKKFVSILSKKIKDDTGIIIKPHQLDTEDYLSLKYHKNIFIADKYDDTYEIFKVIDVHSTVYSTSCLEALAFGKPNIFIKTGIDIKDFFDIVDYESSFIVDSPDSFFEKLESIKSHYKEISNHALKKSEKFFCLNSLDNIKTFVDRLG